MVYRGRVKNGTVILDEGVVLPEGTLVRVEPVEPRPLLELAKALEGVPLDGPWPPDRAAKVDEYLYGNPSDESSSCGGK